MLPLRARAAAFSPVSSQLSARESRCSFSPRLVTRMKTQDALQSKKFTSKLHQRRRSKPALDLGLLVASASPPPQHSPQNTEDPLVGPSPSLTATEAVEVQLRALEKDDEPWQGHGVQTGEDDILVLKFRVFLLFFFERRPPCLSLSPPLSHPNPTSLPLLPRLGLHGHEPLLLRQVREPLPRGPLRRKIQDDLPGAPPPRSQGRGDPRRRRRERQRARQGRGRDFLVFFFFFVVVDDKSRLLPREVRDGKEERFVAGRRGGQEGRRVSRM